MLTGKGNQYPPATGIPELRQAVALPGRAGVAAIPSGVFYDDNPEAGATMVRFAFCKRPGVLTEALRRLSVLAR